MPTQVVPDIGANTLTPAQETAVLSLATQAARDAVSAASAATLAEGAGPGVAAIPPSPLPVPYAAPAAGTMIASTGGIGAPSSVTPTTSPLVGLAADGSWVPLKPGGFDAMDNDEKRAYWAAVVTLQQSGQYHAVGAGWSAGPDPSVPTLVAVTPDLVRQYFDYTNGRVAFGDGGKAINAALMQWANSGAWYIQKYPNGIVNAAFSMDDDNLPIAPDYVRKAWFSTWGSKSGKLTLNDGSIDVSIIPAAPITTTTKAAAPPASAPTVIAAAAPLLVSTVDVSADTVTATRTLTPPSVASDATPPTTAASSSAALWVGVVLLVVVGFVVLIKGGK